ncbi:MAG: hypothetical protein GY938_07340 [Ketobacter sp.]|nr:hypothetical protein [Ketobacter sp.]
MVDLLWLRVRVHPAHLPVPHPNFLHGRSMTVTSTMLPFGLAHAMGAQVLFVRWARPMATCAPPPRFLGARGEAIQAIAVANLARRSHC